jgi:TonB family protein
LKRACWLLSVSLLCALQFLAQAAPSTQVGSSQVDREKSLNILSASTLESSDSQPFVLRVEYQLFDLEGNPGVKGKAEEFWTKNDGELVSVESSSLEIGGGPLVDAYEAADRETYLVRQAMNAIVRPFPPDDIADPKRLSQAGPNVFYPTNGMMFCLSNQGHIVTMTDHLSVAERSNFRRYDNHDVPGDIKLSYEGKPALTMHIVDLGSFSSFSDSKDATGMPKPIPMRPQVHDAVLLPHNPVKYPFSADYQRLGGGVRIVAVVTMQGKIADLDVIASPQKTIAKAASDAVRKWVFQPYLLKGAPAEFETTIDVDFLPRR